MDISVNSKAYVVIDCDYPNNEDYPLRMLSKEQLGGELLNKSIRDKSIVLEVLVKKKFTVDTTLVLNLMK